MSVEDPRTPARKQAATTRAASSPSVNLLSRPDSPYFAAVEADDRYRSNGTLQMVQGYDVNHPPPEAPEDSSADFTQRLPIEELVDVIQLQLPSYPRGWARAAGHGAKALLRYLTRCSGSTWNERWLASGFDAAPRRWMTYVDERLPICAEGSPSQLGMNVLLQLRVLRPSYHWLINSRRKVNYANFLKRNGGVDYQRMQELPAYVAALPKYQVDAEHALARVLIRTGKDIRSLRGDDLLYYSDVVRTSGRPRKEHLLWELLVCLGPLADEAPTMRAAWSANGNTRQHSTDTLVDRYGIPPSGVRDMLVDYLAEIRPNMDYSSLEGIAYRLARLFWLEILRINPEQSDLHLSADVATEWRERLTVTANGQPRREIYSTLFNVRGLYRDLAEWSHDDPVRWGVWVAPCPVPRQLSHAVSKEKRRQKSRMQDRTRMLTPLLPSLLSAVSEHKRRSSEMLALAQSCEHGSEFEVDGLVFTRDSPPIRTPYERRARVWVRVKNEDARPNWTRLRSDRIDVTALEEDAFWAWAIVETLRHSGIRIEELLELTQLSLRHYKAPQTGTLVPLLHIVPSKTDCERLIPMTPDLVQVLLEVLRRGKDDKGRVALSIRYDYWEKTHGQPFPHLFARKVGTRQEVFSTHYVSDLLKHSARLADLRDADQPIYFTPHDFRRLFATDAVNNGLPLHIAAALLGHLNLDTTRGYTAVFPEHLIAAHQAFVERRRLLRPEAEGQIADDVDWEEFEQHFLLRRVALGECHRPYGTPCVHEHACTRCRFLRVDPAQLGRIEEMTTNAEDRLAEAHDKGWLGEVAALEESIKHLRKRGDEARQRLKQSDPFADAQE